MLVAFVPRDEITFTDGWHVQGLKGTGSYDYNCQDVFVPECRTMPLFSREPLRGNSAAGRMGLMAVTAAGHASWALGVAKSMLDDVEELAATKVRMSDMATLGHPADLPEGPRPPRRGVAGRPPAGARRLHGGGGRSHRGRRPDTRRCGPTCAWRRSTPPDVARACAEWAHLAAGTTSIREGSRLERAFPRHVHRHPACVHQREGRHRRGADLARHRRRPVRAC